MAGARKRGLSALVLALFGLVGGPEALAAVRTVQFTGLMGADFTVGAVGNEAGVAYCAIAIVNTGEQNQRIVNIEMLPYFQGNQRTAGFMTNGILYTMRRVGQAPLNTPGNTPDNSLSNPPSNACLNQTLAPGSICVARIASSTILLDGRYLVCAGRVTVEDLPNTPPGSVTAAGSITINQEAVLLGGVMSGAYYQSGSHILDRDNLEQMSNPATHDIFSSSPNPPGATSAQNMNIYCARACRMDSGYGPLSRAECQELCGYGSGSGAASNGPDGEWNPWNPVGIITESPAFGGKPFCANGSASDGDPADPNGTACNNWATFGSYTPGQYTTSTMYPRSSPKLVIKAANAHYAGGMVYEMIMGPMNVICSANRAYWAAGGNEMLHADGVDDHAIVFGSDTTYPPERLFCSHRHAEDDLHLRVGSTSSFTINGGNPF